MNLIEIVGWAGSIAVLAAYALLSTGRLHARSLAYQWINIGGGLGMVINGWAHGAFPSVFNNLIWMAIGFIALARIFYTRAKARTSPVP